MKPKEFLLSTITRGYAASSSKRMTTTGPTIGGKGGKTFISHLYEGSISDVNLVVQSGLLQLLERGDSVMADKGFDIQHLLSGIGV